METTVDEQVLLALTECSSLKEINVLSLRNKNLTHCLRILSQCPSLIIAYL